MFSKCWRQSRMQQRITWETLQLITPIGNASILGTLENDGTKA